ncbi:PA domain-containing protein [Massilia sp. Mn16-1_5]|uniref:PA domain-containing protein n=1 Tax=Massilia sp. Mn16-1_5 TaxID=2079199 RepID=UPI00109E3A34|nr:PA domain-containing protein [Massilia sp. Mn16-1_5]THC40776.1 peptidase [Massilia sp. Mn16-1_5]
MTKTSRTLSSLLLSGAALAGALCSAQAATVTIINQNAPGVGFNDPTPVAPVGGNTGTTLGQQRLIAFQHAADIWGATLSSTVPIRIGASFVPLSCTENSAVLGSAGANEIFADFTNAPRPNTWYPSALASKLAGVDTATPGEPHIVARFNSRLGLFPDCLPGPGFYLGLDNNAGEATDLVTVLLHEMAHGLGFQTFTDDETGAEILDIPSVWDHFLVDNRNEQLWVNMTPEQRVASAISSRGLSWNGPIVTAAVPAVLDPRSRLTVFGKAAGKAAGDYLVGDASFGPPLGRKAVKGQVMPVIDQPDGTGLACAPLPKQNAWSIRGNIALVSRGTCPFVDKARNVQAAGAIAMIVADNAPGEPTGLSGSDPSIRIPSVRISQADGVRLRAALQTRSRHRSGVLASLGVYKYRLAGADEQRRILMYTPNPNQPGSSVSHYTTEAKPNQLMEPSINSDLSHTVTPPRDLTYPLLRDIGW